MCMERSKIVFSTNWLNRANNNRKLLRAVLHSCGTSMQRFFLQFVLRETDYKDL